MADKFDTVGIMFANHGDGKFPTVREVSDSYGYLNALGMELGEVWDWYAIAYDPRGYSYGEEDNRAMDVTNWDAIVSECGDIPEIRYIYRSVTVGALDLAWQSEGLEEALAAGVATVHGVSGTLLAVGPTTRQYPEHEYAEWDSPDLLIDRMRELSRRLADYPLLDEEAYSAREWEAWQEYAPMALSDEIRDARRDGTYAEEWLDSVEERESGDVLNVVCQHLDYYYGFSGEYAPEFLAILDGIENGKVDA